MKERGQTEKGDETNSNAEEKECASVGLVLVSAKTKMRKHKTIVVAIHLRCCCSPPSPVRVWGNFFCFRARLFVGLFLSVGIEFTLLR